MSDPSRAVVRLLVRHERKTDFLGTGFLISPRLVVTCTHVIARHPDDALWITGALWHGGGRRVVKRFDETKRDVSVLELDGSSEDVPQECILRLTTRDPPASKANDTNVIGFFDLFSDVLSRPVPVIGYEGWSMTRVLQSGMAPGMSGSPAVVNGAVWGILQARDIERDLCYIIPIRSVLDFLKRVPGVSSEQSTLYDRLGEHGDIGALVDQIWPPLFETVRLSSPQDFDALRAFFLHVLRVSLGGGHEGIVDLIDLIDELPSDRSALLIRLRGAQGTGKSTAALVLNAALRHHANQSGGPTPILIDAEKYLREPPDPKPNSVRRIVQNDFQRLRRALDHLKGSSFVLLLDGMAADNPSAEDVLRLALDAFDTDAIRAIVVAVSDSFEPQLTSVLHNAGVHFPHRDLMLVPVSIDDPHIDEFLNHYVALFDQLRGRTTQPQTLPERSKALRERLKTFGFSGVDIHVVSVILTKIDVASYAGIRALVHFLEKYSRERLGGVRGEADTKTLNSAAALAMRVTISSIFPTEMTAPRILTGH
jgi:Trypsin-like peptidase domain